jgi:hypothetical protein
VVTASFCCPTVTANQGTPLQDQERDLARLQGEWSRSYPEPEGEILFVPGRPIEGAALAALRSILRQMLDRPGAGGAPDLRASLDRMARYLEDLSRHRVLMLTPAAFAEYLELTGRYAARDERPFTPRPPSRLARVLFRGFLYAVVASRLQLEDRRHGGLRLGLRWRLARVLAHFHGLGPAVAGVDLGAARRASLDLGAPEVRGLAHNYLRASIETLGTGRRPVLEEIGLAVAFLGAGCVLAAMRTGQGSVDAATFAEGLMDAVDLTHAESSGLFGSMLGTLSGGVEALYLFASGARV